MAMQWWINSTEQQNTFYVHFITIEFDERIGTSWTCQSFGIKKADSESLETLAYAIIDHEAETASKVKASDAKEKKTPKKKAEKPAKDKEQA